MFVIGLPAPPAIWLQLIAIACVAVGMITDLIRGKIYNVLTFPMIFIGWVANFYCYGLSGLGYSVLATLLGIALYLPAAAVGIVGMGDVKLLAGIGAICGFKFTLTAFLYACILGVPHALFVQKRNYGKDALSMLSISFAEGAFRDKTIQNTAMAPGRKLHLGVDLFLGALLAFFVNLSILW